MERELSKINEVFKKILYYVNSEGGGAEALTKNLIKYGLDNVTDGFWIYDFQNNDEFYSPRFRQVLGFQDEKDFPNTPESWKKNIVKDYLPEVEKLLKEHIDSLGREGYFQEVEYWNKDRTRKVKLLCEGAVVEWDNQLPVIMIGTHKVIKKPDTFAG